MWLLTPRAHARARTDTPRREAVASEHGQHHGTCKLPRQGGYTQLAMPRARPGASAEVPSPLVAMPSWSSGVAAGPHRLLGTLVWSLWSPLHHPR